MRSRLLALLIIVLPVVLPAQTPKEPVKEAKPAAPAAAEQAPKAPAPTPKPPDENFVRWRIFLDTLAQEARSVPDERRPYVVADVAAAYLEFDRDEATRLITSAYDEALKFRMQDEKKYQTMFKYVSTVGSRFGTDVAIALADRAKKAAEADKEKSDKPTSAADINDSIRESVSQDARRAADAAKSVAPNGIKEGTSAMSVIFSLAAQNQALGDEVYMTYLTKAAGDDSIPVGAFLQMAGYAFGYNETQYLSNQSSSSMSGDAVIKPDPSLAPAFLSAAYRKIKLALDNSGEGATLSSSDGGIILFATGYLVPEVRTFAPDTLPAWLELQQRAMTGRTPEQIRGANDRVASVFRNRPKKNEVGMEVPTGEEEADALLADIEKKSAGCPRDTAYTQAVSRLLQAKNLKRADELIDKISDADKVEKLRVIWYSRRIDAFVNQGDLDSASKDAYKVPTIGDRAVQLIKVAGAYGRAQQAIEAGKIADDAAKTTEKIESPKDRAAAYFTLSSILLRSQPRDAYEALDKGIKNLNKVEPQDTWDSKLGQVSLEMGCPVGKSGSTWSTSTGSGGQSLLAVVPNFAKQDLDTTNGSVDSITDKATKIRAQAIIAKTALAKYKPKN